MTFVDVTDKYRKYADHLASRVDRDLLELRIERHDDGCLFAHYVFPSTPQRCVTFNGVGDYLVVDALISNTEAELLDLMNGLE